MSNNIKRIRVRDATARDKGLFRKLWTEMLYEQVDDGAIIAPTDRTLGLYESIFDAYVTGEVAGVVLFIADKAVLMWGESNALMDFTVGRTANYWGSYVMEDARGNGMGVALQNAAFERLRKMGFDAVTGIVLQAKDQEEIPGWQPSGVFVSYDLVEVEDVDGVVGDAPIDEERAVDEDSSESTSDSDEEQRQREQRGVEVDSLGE